MNLIEKIKAHQSLKSFDSDSETPVHQPEMLLIGCVDARKDPIADLGIPKGKCLILRNIAALIRGTSVEAKQRETEAAALEFAVKVMKVKHIAVMGHTDCGGIRASLMNVDFPDIKNYLSPLKALRQQVREQGISIEEQQSMLEKEAVRMSVQNLLTYDYIKERVDNGTLSVHGWIIDISCGELIDIV